MLLVAYPTKTRTQVTEHIESLLTMMDFRGRWEPIDRFIKLGGIQLMLQVMSLLVLFFLLLV